MSDFILTSKKRTSEVDTACSFSWDLLVVSATKNFTDLCEVWSRDSLQEVYPERLSIVNLGLVTVILY